MSLRKQYNWSQKNPVYYVFVPKNTFTNTKMSNIYIYLYTYTNI